MRSFLTFLWIIFYCSVISFCQSVTANSGSLPLKNTPLLIWDVQLNINVTGNGAIKDGSFFYVADGFSNLIRAYNSSGNLLYTFAITGASNLKDLTYDGMFEYGVNGGNQIYQMNFPIQTLIGTINTPVTARCVAYDYTNDAFWIGGSDPDLYLITRSGVVLGTLSNIQLPGKSGLAYDGESPGGPYLWLYAGIDADTINIYQINIAEGTFTGIQHNVLSDVGSGQTGAVPGGLFFMDEYIPNTSSLGGILVGSSASLFVYEINNAVPVEFISFKGICVRDDVVLNWSTATETNNKGFEILRKKTSLPEGIQKGWTKAGFINGKGTNTERNSYSFLDKRIPLGDYLYMLKQIDFDGTYSCSKEIEVSMTAPSGFLLAQNYPNPFNPTTTISYRLPVKGFVRIKIFNALGKEVVSLVKEEQPAGSYSVRFEANNLPSGIYIYQLQVNDYIGSRQMMLLK